MIQSSQCYRGSKLAVLDLGSVSEILYRNILTIDNCTVAPRGGSFWPYWTYVRSGCTVAKSVAIVHVTGGECDNNNNRSIDSYDHRPTNAEAISLHIIFYASLFYAIISNRLILNFFYEYIHFGTLFSGRLLHEWTAQQQETFAHWSNLTARMLFSFIWYHIIGFE